MAFRDLVGELIGVIPGIPPDYAEKTINKAWRMVQDIRMWSFNYVDNAQIWIPGLIQAGAMQTTFGSVTMIADATAITALTAAVFSNPPLADPQIGVGRQIRIGSSNTGLSNPAGPIYTILAFDAGTGAVTLDRPYGEQSVTAAPYLCYRCYFTPPNNPNTSFVSPDSEFIRYWTIRNIYRGYNITGKALYRSQEFLNSIDPQRGSFNDAFNVAQWGRNRQSHPIHEFYPHPTYQNTYVAAYQIRWGQLSRTQDLPAMPYSLSDLVMAQAKMLGCQWALANVSTEPKLAQTNWVAAAANFAGERNENRIQCIKIDDEIAPKLPTVPGNVSVPLGGEFIQSHDLSFLR